MDIYAGLRKICFLLLSFLPWFQEKILQMVRVKFIVLCLWLHMCINAIEFTVLKGKESNTLMEGFQKGLDNFMTNNNICNYTCYYEMKVINSHVLGQGLIGTRVRKSYFLPFMEFFNCSDALRFFILLSSELCDTTYFRVELQGPSRGQIFWITKCARLSFLSSVYIFKIMFIRCFPSLFYHQIVKMIVAGGGNKRRIQMVLFGNNCAVSPHMCLKRMVHTYARGVTKTAEFA